MNSLPPLNSLYHFLFAAKNLSFKKASEDLFVTQAAVSQQIKMLEDFLEKKLFIRKPRTIELTKDGKLLFSYVEKGFEHFRQGVDALSEDPMPDRLTISVIPSFASRWLVPRLKKFLDQNNGLTVRLEPSMENADFINSDIDLGIRFGRGNYQGLESYFLMNDYMFPACHPSLLINKALNIEQLRHISLLEDDIITVWDQFFEELGVDGTKFAKTIQISDSNMLVEAALSCQGVAMLRHSLVFELIKKNLLVRPFETIIKSEFSYYLIAPSSHFKREKVIKFSEWLQSELKFLIDDTNKLLKNEVNNTVL